MTAKDNSNTNSDNIEDDDDEHVVAPLPDNILSSPPPSAPRPNNRNVHPLFNHSPLVRLLTMLLGEDHMNFLARNPPPSPSNLTPEEIRRAYEMDFRQLEYLVRERRRLQRQLDASLRLLDRHNGRTSRRNSRSRRHHHSSKHPPPKRHPHPPKK